MVNVLLVGLGGFFGASARYLLGAMLQRMANPSAWPAGTLGVNVLGCLLIGLLGRWSLDSGWLNERGHLLIVVGVLGGFTTFSSFGFETVELLRAKQGWGALLYVSASVVLGLLAVVAGYFVAGHHR